MQKNQNKPGWKVKLITKDEIPEIKDMTTKSSGSTESIMNLDEVIGMKDLTLPMPKGRRF